MFLVHVDDPPPGAQFVGISFLNIVFRILLKHSHYDKPPVVSKGMLGMRIIVFAIYSHLLLARFGPFAGLGLNEAIVNHLLVLCCPTTKQ